MRLALLKAPRVADRQAGMRASSESLTRESGAKLCG